MKDSDQLLSFSGLTMPSRVNTNGACTKASIAASECQRLEEVPGTVANWESCLEDAGLVHGSIDDRAPFDSPDGFHNMGYGAFESSNPSSNVKIVPTDDDVLFGKGGTMNHEGNKAFRAIGERLAPRYFENDTPAVEDAVALDLVHYVHDQGGRFLDKDGDSGLWRVAEFEKAHEKAKQLLRDLKKKRPTNSGKKRSHDQSYDGDNHDVSHPQASAASHPRHKAGASKKPKPMIPEKFRTKRGPKPHSRKLIGLCRQQPIESFASNKQNNRDQTAGMGQASVSTNYAAARCTEESPKKLFWVCVATTKESLRKSLVEGIKQLDDPIAGKNYSRNNNNYVKG